MSPSTLAPAQSVDIVSSGFFVLRTPLLPFDALASWSDGLIAPSVSGDPGTHSLSEALEQDRAMLEERLRLLMSKEEIREALFLASPSLDEAVQSWLGDPACRRARNVIGILVRYLARMSGRCIPFGLFSGCSLGRIGKDTLLEIAPRAEYRRHTRLDSSYLCDLCAVLGKNPEVRAKLRFKPNSGLYSSAGQLRYPEARVDLKTRERSYCLVNVELTEYLRATLAGAVQGATLRDLAQALVDEREDVTLAEAQAYLDELVDSQILVSDLSPTVTGSDALDELVQTLQRCDAFAADVLSAASAELRAMDRERLGLSPARYKRVAATLEQLPLRPELGRLFHVDVFKPAPRAELGHDVLGEMQRAVDLLARIPPPTSTTSSDLRCFREAFRRRYDDREVPLADVLDSETGIGFEGKGAAASEPSPLLRGLRFPAAEADAGSRGENDDWLLSRLALLLRTGAREWKLDAADLESMPGPSALPPPAFAITAVLAGASPEAVAAGRFRLWIQQVSGPSGAALLGRFCLGDAELGRRVEEHLRAEEALHPSAIFAEVVHLPPGRGGNVVFRPQLRDYEIPFLGRSGAPLDRQIPLSDLSVSVRGDRIVLRSMRLGKEIVPRLTAANDFATGSVPAYRFLCALKAQDVDAALGWSWGSLANAPFLPRVTYGRVILSLAQWNLRRDDLKRLSDAKSDAAQRYRAVAALRASLELPRWVAVVDFDDVLPVDLDNVLQVDAFAELVRNRDSVVLRELFPGLGQSCANGPDGAFMHELIVPFVCKRTPQDEVRLPKPVVVRRTFPPGSEWLYAKLYAGPATVDCLLREVVAPLAKEARDRGDADRWFFLRHGDPDWHLRVRFHGDPRRLVERVLPRLYDRVRPFVANGRVSRFQLDTYEREVERYGGDRAIAISEEIFYADSDAAMTILLGTAGDEAAEARWRLTLRGIHLILVDLGFGLGERLAFVQTLRAALATEYGISGPFDRQLGDRFRAERSDLEPLLGATAQEVDSTLRVGFAALETRSRTIQRHAPELARLERQGVLSRPLSEIAHSYVHMHANRLLRSAQRMQELVLYDFLERLYESEAARMDPRRPVGADLDPTANLTG